jgi:hypothetical protein
MDQHAAQAVSLFHQMLPHQRSKDRQPPAHLRQVMFFTVFLQLELLSIRKLKGSCGL